MCGRDRDKNPPHVGVKRGNDVVTFLFHGSGGGVGEREPSARTVRTRNNAIDLAAI